MPTTFEGSSAEHRRQPLHPPSAKQGRRAAPDFRQPFRREDLDRDPRNLEPSSKKFAGKRILHNNDILPFSGEALWYQQVARIPDAPRALLDYLSEARQRNVILIRDAPANPGRQPTRRQKAGGERGDHGFHDTPTRLFPVDIDKARINWRDDPEAAVRRLQLPARRAVRLSLVRLALHRQPRA